MKQSKLWMAAALSAVVLSSGCAHEQEVTTVVSAPAAPESLGWPMLPMYEHPAAEFPRAEVMAEARSEENQMRLVNTETDVRPVSVSATASASASVVAPAPGSIAAAAPASALASPAVKPSEIKFPDAKTSGDDVVYDTPLIFDIPVAYNSRVKYWVEYFQTSGRPWYTKWLERSSRYLPVLQKTLKQNGLPQDLAYIAMIESGFSSQAYSPAKAVGPWQFIRETGKRYGLKVTWWLDERRDFQKSTDAAARYLKKMYGMFHNWYLVAAGYNTGEYRIKRMVEKHGTSNFWKIAQKKDLEEETRDYVPKLIAALLIAKAPQMYGFKNINYSAPLTFEHFRVPGGTRLDALADAIGVTSRYMAELNPELVRGYVPNFVDSHMIRIPKGSSKLVGNYVRKTFVSER